MSDDGNLERTVERLERERKELGSILRQATREIAALEGVGGLWARLTGSDERRRRDAEQVVERVTERLRALEPELKASREVLAASRRLAAEAYRAAEHAVPEAEALPSDPELTPEARAARQEAVTLMEARHAARKLSEAIDDAVTQAQATALANRRRSRSFESRYRPSMSWEAVRGLSVLETLRSVRMHVADQRVSTAMQRLEAALELADVKGWHAEGSERSGDTFGLIREVLTLTGTVYDPSLGRPEQRRDELLDLSGMVAMLDDHLETRIAEARAQLDRLVG